MHELLMDTGLGAKAYAIIEQGKIGMILSSRPADRRQLIEEAAGITKYKARRRSAELKLEAAQQNLTRIDDIVFEVDKQRGSAEAAGREGAALSAAARRAAALGEGAVRPEVPRAGADDRVGARRGWPTRASAKRSPRRGVAEVETATRRAAHRAGRGGRDGDRRARIARTRTSSTSTGRSSRSSSNRQQIGALGARITELDGEVGARSSAARAGSGRSSPPGVPRRRTPSRRGPTRRRRAGRREQEAYRVAAPRDRRARSDVEAARSEVFAALNQLATALRHAIDNAAAARERVQEALSRLDVEAADLRVENEHAVVGSACGRAKALRRAHAALEATRAARTALRVRAGLARASQARLSAAAPVARTRAGRAHGPARLARGARSGAGRLQRRGPRGARRRPTASPAAGRGRRLSGGRPALRAGRRGVTGDLLQHVIVPTHAHAAAGLQLLREREAGRCGFLVVADGGPSHVPPDRGRWTPVAVVRGARQRPVRFRGRSVDEVLIAELPVLAKDHVAEAKIPDSIDLKMLM